jgi:hypothetical protein
MPNVHQKLVVDVETVGVDFETLDTLSQEQLTRYFERYTKDNEELEEQKDKLGFWPLTGQIVAIGVYNPDTKKGCVYLQTNGEGVQTEIEPGITIETGNEKEILKKFWNAALKYNMFITFNGRMFDAPYLMLRSAINEVRPSKNLLANRYVSSQPFQALHVDLNDQLGFYGATRRSFSLHFWCNAFGIESPKATGVTGDDVKQLFKDGKYFDIARYNAGDLKATAALYEKWDNFLNF